MSNMFLSPQVSRDIPVIDVAAAFVDLEASDSGSLIGTTNSTGGMGGHNINLPAATQGIWYIVVTDGSVFVDINVDGAETIEMPDGGGNAAINIEDEKTTVRLSCQVAGTWTVEYARGEIKGDVTGLYYGDGGFEAVGDTKGSLQQKDATGNTDGSSSSNNLFLGDNGASADSTQRMQMAGNYAKGFWPDAAYRSSGQLGGAYTDAGASQGLEGVHLRRLTTDDTPVAMTTQGDVVLLTMEDDRLYCYEAIIAAKNMKATNEVVMWKVQFAALGANGAGAPLLVGKNITRVAETANGDEADWDVDVKVNNLATDEIEIEVTGEAGHTIGWGAFVWGSEVEGYTAP